MNNRSFLLVLVALLSAMMAQGCSVHELRSEAYPLTMPESYKAASPQEGEALTGRWWERFGDEGLNRLVEEALKGNLDISQAYERFRQGQAAFRATDAARGLQLGLGAGGGRVRQAGPFDTITSDSYRLSAAMGYELDLWNRLSSRSGAALLDADASLNDLRALHMTIAASVVDLYYLAVEQRAQLELSDRIIASFRETVESVERRYREGLVPALDVYQSRQNLAAAQSRRPVFEAKLAVTLNALSQLLGRFPTGEEPGGLSALADAPTFPVGLPSELLARRPDINAALLRLRASDERVGAAVADRFPSFSLSGTVGGASTRLKTILDSPNIFWNLLIEIAQPVLDGGRRRAEVDRAEAIFRERLAAYHESVITSFREVEDALARNREAEDLVGRIGERRVSARSELRLALDNYFLGVGDYLPVLTAQRSYYETESSLLDARRRLISSRIELARAVGGDWVDPVLAGRLGAEGNSKEE